MNCEIRRNVNVKGDYFLIAFAAPEIAAAARPGQFVHVRIDERQDRVLRRPFSIHDAGNGEISILYKVVGGGTAALSQRRPGECCDLMGPLGNAFVTPAGHTPLLVTGGYGAAATFLLTRNAPRPGVLLFGARSAADVILTEKYLESGFDVRVATNDGSEGIRGFVTDLIEPLLAERPEEKFFVHGCGPRPMLLALTKKLRALGVPGELSVDQVMCCGVGACFGCVVRINDPDSPEGWRYARSCSEGPVFGLDAIYTE